MKLTFIGSSHGVPEPNRKCACLMVEVGEHVYFVDMGCPAIDALRTKGIPVDAVKGIFITHMHGDHTNGLIQFVDLMTWYFKSADPVICLPMMEAAQVIDNWLKATLNNIEKKINYRQTEEGVVFDDGVLKVTAIPTRHCQRSFAYLLEAEGKAVLATGDLNGDPEHPATDFPAVAKEIPLDLLICESAHFPATTYLPLLEGCDVKKVCINHYSPRHLPSIIETIQALEGRGIPALMATDDLQITV